VRTVLRPGLRMSAPRAGDAAQGYTVRLDRAEAARLWTWGHGMTHEVALTLGAMGGGFLWGLQHATEPDHVVAVSAIVTEQRNIWKSSLVGALWGLGHTLALLATGLVLIKLRLEIPEAVRNWFETAVAVMIVLLGVGVIRRVRRDGTIHIHAHEHDGRRHIHF